MRSVPFLIKSLLQLHDDNGAFDYSNDATKRTMNTNNAIVPIQTQPLKYHGIASIQRMIGFGEGL